MREDNVKYLLSIIAGLAALLLGLVYYFWPATATSHRLHALLVDCIPDAIVALIAIPIIYWLFYRRGLANMGDCPLLAKQNDGTAATQPLTNGAGFMRVIPEEISKAASDDQEPQVEQDLLVVVDMQHDFINGSLKAHNAVNIIQPVNNAIHMAEAAGMQVVFTRDWHPADHWSFEENGGPWSSHCIMNTRGADLSPDVYRPNSSVVLDFGMEPGTAGYSAFENAVLDLLVSNPQVRNVYVIGIALEYCVQATCLGAKERGKRTIALEQAIASASADIEETEKIWQGLVKEGIIRERRLTVLSKRGTV